MLKQLKPATLAGPALLAGDLNATADSAELKPLFTFWQPTWPAEKPGFTWPTEKPQSRIDHLLLQPKVGWTVDKTFRGDEAFPDDQGWIELLSKASDHLPVVLEFASTQPPAQAQTAVRRAWVMLTAAALLPRAGEGGGAAGEEQSATSASLSATTRNDRPGGR